ATVLNVLRCVAWAVFELIGFATAAVLLCAKLFGFEPIWAWKLAFGGVATVLALMGPIGFVRRFVRKFAIWAVAASVVYLAWWIVDGANLGHLWSHPGSHHGSFWLAVDTVVAVTVSWAPLVADYTRFSRDRRTAFVGVGLGYLLPTFFQFGFGSILVLSRGVDPNRPELTLTAIAGRGLGAASPSGNDRRLDRRLRRLRVARPADRAWLLDETARAPSDPVIRRGRVASELRLRLHPGFRSGLARPVRLAACDRSR